MYSFHNKYSCINSIVIASAEKIGHTRTVTTLLMLNIYSRCLMHILSQIHRIKWTIISLYVDKLTLKVHNSKEIYNCIVTYSYIYTPDVAVILETSCPLILVTTLLLVVKHSTTLTVVTGVELMVVWVSLTIVTQLLGWDKTEMFCCLWGKQLTVTVEDEDEITVEIKSMHRH